MDFYNRVFRVFLDLKGEGIVEERQSGDFAVLLNRLRCRINAWSWQLVFLVVSLLLTLLLGATGTGGRWGLALAIGIRTWLGFLIWMSWFLAIYFAYKCYLTWQALRQLRNPEKFAWRLDDDQRFGGIQPLASMWFRVYVIIVLLGCLLSVFGAFRDAWRHPGILGGMASYTVVAPLLFWGTLYSVHQIMSGHKSREVEKAMNRLRSARFQLESKLASIDTASASWKEHLLVYFGELDLERKRQLPTWPANIIVLRTVLLYTLPYVLGAISNLVYP